MNEPKVSEYLSLTSILAYPLIFKRFCEILFFMENKNKGILSSWPFKYDPRGVQVTALEWLEKQDKKHLIIELPVGSGKSNIGMVLSTFLGTRTKFGDSFVLTPQRILQEQYEKSFMQDRDVQIASLYGKVNYRCHTKGGTCELGSALKPRCRNCPHTKAKDLAKKCANTVLNYKLALTSFAYTDTFKPRKLMILDECHTLENHLVDFDTVSIAEWRCKKYKIQWHRKTTIPEALEWMKDYYLEKIRDKMDELEEECEPLYDKSGVDLTKGEIRKIKELTSLIDHVDDVVEMCSRNLKYIEANFVLTHDKTRFEFKRLSGAYSFKKLVLPKADRFLYMSSTVLDKDGFCEDLGIDPNDAAFLSLGSEFPPEKRPVYYMPCTKMNAAWASDENLSGRRKLVKTLREILEVHTEHSGIIHTGNFAISKWLVDELDGDTKHKIFHHNPESGDDRNHVITTFQNSTKPSILISPSITEGLDLKDDLSRFAIFAKIPFGNLGDQWIKRRMELSLRWYQRRALIDIIQGGGRVVRDSTDWGNVYILDLSWSYLYRQTFFMLPKWWKEAYHTI